MANQEHIKILEQGVEAWNRWRDANPDIEPDLSRIVINQILPEKEYFDIYGYEQKGVILKNINFSKTKLYKANLEEASLEEANLQKANFQETKLYMANLYMANLEGVNIRNAFIGSTLFTGVDLSEVKNLDKTKHREASSIGIDTIVKSKGKIPDIFLRGCGVPDSFIEYIPSFIQGMNPIEFYSCFISHSLKDKNFARRLHNDLRGKGVRTWFDEKDMRGGKKMHEQIFHNVKVYDKLLLILSDDSMNSSWVKTEIKEAIKDEKKTGKQKLFPIRLVDYKNIKKWKFFYGKIGQDLADEICEYYIPDFSNWDKDNKKYQKEFEKLLRDIEKGKKKIS